MSSTTSQTITQQGPVYTKMEKDDPLKDKIIEHFNQLTFDPDFQKASATYSQIKEQHEQIRIRDAKLAKLEKDIKAQEGNKVLALSKLSAVNQFLTTQKEEAEAKNFSLRKEATEREKSLTEVSRRMKELQSQIQAQLLQKSSDERKMNSIAEKYKLDIDSLQRKLKKSDEETDNIKATNANLTSLLAVEKTKNGRLREEKKSLDEEMQKTRSRLEKLDGFILVSHQIDEQAMSVTSWKMSCTLLTLYSRMDDFSALWDYAKNEIWSVLGQNLREEDLRVSLFCAYPYSRISNQQLY
jgi:DNA repair exonuclease SbcCD ATPase subunit